MQIQTLLDHPNMSVFYQLTKVKKQELKNSLILPKHNLYLLKRPGNEEPKVYCYLSWSQSFRVWVFCCSLRINAAGTSAAAAIANSLRLVHRLNTSSNDWSSESKPPVCTQTKLYGIRPGNNMQNKKTILHV